MAPHPLSYIHESIDYTFSLISSGVNKVIRLIYEKQPKNLSEISVYPEVKLERSQTNSVQAF